MFKAPSLSALRLLNSKTPSSGFYFYKKKLLANGIIIPIFRRDSYGANDRQPLGLWSSVLPVGKEKRGQHSN